MYWNEAIFLGERNFSEKETISSWVKHCPTKREVDGESFDKMQVICFWQPKISVPWRCHGGTQHIVCLLILEFPGYCCLQFVELLAIFFRVDDLDCFKEFLVHKTLPIPLHWQQNFLWVEAGFSDRNGTFVSARLGLSHFVIIFFQISSPVNNLFRIWKCALECSAPTRHEQSSHWRIILYIFFYSYHYS